MFENEINQTIKLLQNNNIAIGEGMTEAQVEYAEQFYKIVFPPDLKALLMAFTMDAELRYNFDGKPYDLTYDWTDYSPDNVKKINIVLEWPIEGALFDVEKNDFWLKEWGEKPVELDDRFEIAERNMRAAPKLIPIYGHRYIPSLPNEDGNPIFSVHQTDIIFYGSNLWEYFQLEYKNIEHKDINVNSIKPVPFWYNLAKAYRYDPDEDFDNSIN